MTGLLKMMLTMCMGLQSVCKLCKIWAAQPHTHTMACLSASMFQQEGQRSAAPTCMRWNCWACIVRPIPGGWLSA